MRTQPFSIEEITDTDALAALGKEWSGLWERCPRATPFQSPEWLLPWWKRFGNNSPFVMALRQRGRLTGLAPLFLFRPQGRGSVQVSLMGTGITDYPDFIIEPEIAREGTLAIIRHLLSRKSVWDSCDFQELRHESPLLSVGTVPGLSMEASSMTVCTRLVLPDTITAFRAGLSARFRKRLRYAGNRLGRAGGINIESAGHDTLNEFMEALFSLHRAAWQERESSGVLADPAVQDFHREVSAAFLRRGRLRLSALRLRGEIISILYSFAAKGSLYCYLSGFAPAASEFSPGRFILWSAIEDAIKEGLREVDFLRGNEGYKYIWNPQERTNYRLRIWHD